MIDTHVLVWAINDDVRLSDPAREVMAEASSQSHLVIAAITPWEIAMLAEKGRLVLNDDVERWIARVLELPGLLLQPLLPEIAIGSVRLPGEFHGDPADRMIVATARFLQAPLLTADQAILSYGAAGHVSVVKAGR